MNNPVLVDYVRSGFVESTHTGSVVLLASDGSQHSLGNPPPQIYPRSSLKPLFATGLVSAGLELTARQLALATASHSGTDEHAQVAREILGSAGLTEDALRCPPDLPREVDDLVALIRAGGSADRAHHNCSGKHAAMLATCVLKSWPTEGYLDPTHPLQVHLRATVTDLAGEEPGAPGVDGCGAPVWQMSLPALARAIARIATASDTTPEGRVAAAARSHPELVGGRRQCVTELMQYVPGLLSKEGAEGVWVAALNDGRAMAAKIDDGAMRALPAILAATLRAWGYSGQPIDRWAADPVVGGGQPVGAILPSAALQDFLATATTLETTY